MNNSNLSFDDAVFEYRNKEYGAYVLRSNQNINQAKGMLVAFSIVLLMIFTPNLIAKFYKPPVDKTVECWDEIILEADPSLPEQKKPAQPVINEIIQPQHTETSPQIQNAPTHVVVDNTPIIENLPSIVTGIDSSFTSAVTSFGGNSGQRNSNQDLGIKNNTDEGPKPPIDSLFTYVTAMPHFPGGLESLNEFLNKNLKYPQIAIENDIQGRVIVKFVVAKTGEINDLMVVRGIGGGCDEEALRVIKSMPNWKPGMHRNKAVKVAYTLPVTFQLQK